MLKSFVDKVSNINLAMNWLKRELPADEIVFASAATVIETKSIIPVKWYERISERPVILMLTKDQLVLKNVLISPVTIFYTIVMITFLSFYILSKEWYPLSMVLLALLHLMLQLPYQQQIPYEDIRKLLVDSRGGARTELIIDTGEKVFHTMFAQTLPQNILNMITSSTKTVMLS